MDRTILHCDCNSFFASVETLLDPSLADGPTAVCGDPESSHGIILAKNEKAKAFGVQTAETIWQAKRKCPDLRLVAPHRSEYVKFSRKCNELYLQYTDLVDPFGIDESFLDVTGSMHLFGSGEHIADELRRRAMITASHETADNVCRVHLALSDGMGEILNLQMLCGGEEQAEKLEENFRKNAEKYYTQIMELLSRDEKV